MIGEPHGMTRGAAGRGPTAGGITGGCRTDAWTVGRCGTAGPDEGGTVPLDSGGEGPDPATDCWSMVAGVALRGAACPLPACGGEPVLPRQPTRLPVTALSPRMTTTVTLKGAAAIAVT